MRIYCDIHEPSYEIEKAGGFVRTFSILTDRKFSGKFVGAITYNRDMSSWRYFEISPIHKATKFYHGDVIDDLWKHRIIEGSLSNIQEIEFIGFPEDDDSWIEQYMKMIGEW